jgi:hypothetical protein
MLCWSTCNSGMVMIALANVFSLALLKSNLCIYMKRRSISKCSGIPFRSPFPAFPLPFPSANIKHGRGPNLTIAWYRASQNRAQEHFPQSAQVVRRYSRQLKF